MDVGDSDLDGWGGGRKSKILLALKSVPDVKPTRNTYS